jgi:alpha-L-fucosidase 2
MRTTSSRGDVGGIDTPAGSLRYTRPASRWFEALPIGNGRLSGMVYGGTAVEKISLSESTAWSGGPSDSDVNPTARENLDTIRQLLFEGDNARAQQLTRDHLLGQPRSFGTNLPLPDVTIDFGSAASATGYERALDLGTAVTSADYELAGIRFHREVLASNPHGLIAVRISADQPAQVSFDLTIGGGVIPGEVRAGGHAVTFDGNAY